VVIFDVLMLLSIISTSLLSFTRLPSAELGVLAVGVSLVSAIGMFLVVYKYAPDRHVKLGPALAGAVSSGVVWTLAKELYRLYLTYADFTRFYGSLGSLVILILWIYYSSVITVFGGELAHAIECAGRSEPKASPNTDH
jgi:membrane protein